MADPRQYQCNCITSEHNPTINKTSSPSLHIVFIKDAKRKEFDKRVKKAAVKLKNQTSLSLYSPEHYFSEILQFNKDNWLTKLEDCFNEFNN